MGTLHDSDNVDDLALLIEQLSCTIMGMRKHGPLSIEYTQHAAGSLTRMQLLLNDLERVEMQVRGISRETADRFTALRCRIQEIRVTIYDGSRIDGR